MLPVHAHVYDILAYYADDVREHFEGGQRPFNYLGIGVQEGGCAERIAEANPVINMTLCDNWGSTHGGTGRGSHDHVEQRLVATGHRGERTYLDGDSAQMIPGLPGSFNLVFVDGDHSEAGALTDLANVWGLVRHGGHVVVHDVMFPEVMAALWQFLKIADRVASVRLYPDGTGAAVIARG